MTLSLVPETVTLSLSRSPSRRRCRRSNVTTSLVPVMLIVVELLDRLTVWLLPER